MSDTNQVNIQEYLRAYSEHSYLSSEEFPNKFGLAFPTTMKAEPHHHEFAEALIRQIRGSFYSQGNPNRYRVFVVKVFDAYLEQHLINELCDLAEKLIAFGCFFFNLYSEKKITLFQQALMTNSPELIGLFIEQANSESEVIPQMKETMIFAIQCGKIASVKAVLQSGYIDPDDLRDPVIAEFKTIHDL